MYKKFEISFREREVTNVSLQPLNRGLSTEMRPARAHSVGAPGYDECSDVEVKRTIAMSETFQQPCTEKTCCASEQEAFTASTLP